MKTGDTVTVHPHGIDSMRWPAIVEICSNNQRSIMVGFENVPPFLKTKDGVAVNMKSGRIVMLLMREALHGKPCGPWVEVTDGGHYEIEERWAR